MGYIRMAPDEFLLALFLGVVAMVVVVWLLTYVYPDITDDED